MDFNENTKKKSGIADKWREVREQMATHLQGMPPKWLFRNRRPLESTNEYALTYRIDNFQPITKQPFHAAVSAIIETANQIHVQEVGVDDRTAELLDEFSIEAAGKKYTLKEYITSYVGRMCESDPNAALVIYPVHPSEELKPDFRELLPDFSTVENQSIDIAIELVGSEKISNKTATQLTFKAGDWLYDIDAGKEYREPYYYEISMDFTALLIPVKDSKKGFEYRRVEYYPNKLAYAPFDIIGYNSVIEEIDGKYEEYFESTYSGAVAIGNEVLAVKSDEQICTTRFTYPEKILQTSRCSYPGCVLCSDPSSKYAGIYVNYDSNGDCSTCQTCSGTGKVAPDTSPFGTHFISKSDLFDMDGKFVPPIMFITPPLESPAYLDEKWRKDYAQMERALFITGQNMTNQSGESKSYDVRQKVTVITAAVKNIYSIYQNALNTVQGYLLGEQDIDVVLPPDFNIKTSEDITEELVTAKNTSSTYTSELTSELLLKKFGNTAVTRKMVTFLELRDKFWGFTMDDIIKAKALYGAAVTAQDQVVHDKGWVILKRMADDEAFLTMSDEQLLQTFNAIISTIAPILETSPIA